MTLHEYCPFEYESITRPLLYKNVHFLENFGTIMRGEKFPYAIIEFRCDEGKPYHCIFVTAENDENSRAVYFDILTVKVSVPDPT